ncbi:proteasome-interacting protein cic1 [Savitreella phatthalungensis]
MPNKSSSSKAKPKVADGPTVAKSGSTSSLLDPSQVLKASRALLKHIGDAAPSKVDHKDLLADEESMPVVFLSITTKKMIVDKRRLKPARVPLPHAFAPEDATVCMFVKDPQRKYKDFVAAAGLENKVTRVVGIEKLKGKHKSFEARRQLLRGNDVFVADAAVAHLLPQLLGKTFYGKKQLPIPIDVPTDLTKVDNLRIELDKALHATYLHLAPGTCTTIKVAHAGQEPKHVQANIMAVAAHVIERFVPQKWAGIRALHIKTADSVALPIYQAEAVYDPAIDHVITQDEVDQQKKLKEEKRAQTPSEKRKRVDGIELVDVREVAPKKSKSNNAPVAEEPRQARAAKGATQRSATRSKAKKMVA